MFSKLHRKMTAFCTSVTGIILIILSIICLSFAQNSIRQNSYTSFLKELGTLLTNLQGQEAISHQWLNQIQENHHFAIYLYDNGMPLHYQKLQQSTSQTSSYPIAEFAAKTARDTYDLDIFMPSSTYLPLHEEFTLTFQKDRQYYASAGILPKENGQVSFIILYPLDDQYHQLFWLRMGILLADIAALSALFIFSRIFTKHMLRPLEENKKKQSQFIASASHELRSPLAVMLSGAESIRKADTPEEIQHFSTLITSEGQRMQRLISDMLLLAGSDSNMLRLHLSMQQPDDLLLHAYEAYEPLARSRQLSFTLLLPEKNLPDCLWDHDRIRQLLSVLLDNALSYTPAGKEILLFLLYHPETLSKNSSIILGVANHGPVIADMERHQIFQRFYRAQSSRTDKEHFGLGLCVAKEIALSHHGHIWVEDCEKLSARFTPAAGFSTLPNFCMKESDGPAFFVELPTVVMHLENIPDFPMDANHL